MNKYKLKRKIKYESGQEDKNTERRKDKTHDWDGFHPNFNELI